MKSALAAAALLGLSATTALAAPTTLWSVDAGSTNGYAEQFDLNGNVLKQVNLGSVTNPGGIAIVGGTGYFTDGNASDGAIHSFNLASGVIGGNISTGSGLAFSALAWDGTGFWASDNGGGNKAFHISLGGTIDKTVTLSQVGSYASGLESFSKNGKTYLIVNHNQLDSSAPYDVYDVSGATAVRVGTSPLLTVANGTAIAVDPTSGTFFVADALDGIVDVFAANGAAAGSFNLGGPNPNTGFDQRFPLDFAIQVPEPMTVALLGAGLAGIVTARRRRT